MFLCDMLGNLILFFFHTTISMVVNKTIYPSFVPHDPERSISKTREVEMIEITEESVDFKT